MDLNYYVQFSEFNANNLMHIKFVILFKQHFIHYLNINTLLKIFFHSK